jgi:hypothetical protein
LRSFAPRLIRARTHEEAESMLKSITEGFCQHS